MAPYHIQNKKTKKCEHFKPIFSFLASLTSCYSHSYVLCFSHSCLQLKQEVEYRFFIKLLSGRISCVYYVRKVSPITCQEQWSHGGVVKWQNSQQWMAGERRKDLHHDFSSHPSRCTVVLKWCPPTAAPELEIRKELLRKSFLWLCVFWKFYDFYNERILLKVIITTTVIITAANIYWALFSVCMPSINANFFTHIL